MNFNLVFWKLLVDESLRKIDNFVTSHSRLDRASIILEFRLLAQSIWTRLRVIRLDGTKWSVGTHDVHIVSPENAIPNESTVLKFHSNENAETIRSFKANTKSFRKKIYLNKMIEINHEVWVGVIARPKQKRTPKKRVIFRFDFSNERWLWNINGTACSMLCAPLHSHQITSKLFDRTNLCQSIVIEINWQWPGEKQRSVTLAWRSHTMPHMGVFVRLSQTVDGLLDPKTRCMREKWIGY